MRYGIPLLAGRIAPRCTIAESMLVVETRAGTLTQKALMPAPGGSWSELLSFLAAERIDALVCGGIARQARRELRERNVTVVDNVAAQADAVVQAIAEDRLRPGFGFGPAEDAPQDPLRLTQVDCLSCPNRVCLRGEPCLLAKGVPYRAPRKQARRMLEAAADIACENERILCRLSELIYFGLEMGYRRLGIAFCWDLLEPTMILVGVLRRFFEIVPISCKISDREVPEMGTQDRTARQGNHHRLTCNPVGQAAALASAGCELNVAVGLCMGADCLFAQLSRAPVTTLFVKDRSLANNPIGALYSDRYLKEALLARMSVEDREPADAGVHAGRGTACPPRKERQ